MTLENVLLIKLDDYLIFHFFVIWRNFFKFIESKLHTHGVSRNDVRPCKFMAPSYDYLNPLRVLQVAFIPLKDIISEFNNHFSCFRKAFNTCQKGFLKYGVLVLFCLFQILLRQNKLFPNFSSKQILLVICAIDDKRCRNFIFFLSCNFLSSLDN